MVKKLFYIGRANIKQNKKETFYSNIKPVFEADFVAIGDLGTDFDHSCFCYMFLLQYIFCYSACFCYSTFFVTVHVLRDFAVCQEIRYFL